MRARNLKPSIFKNDLLAVADPLYTLIFEGLWCMADREGRLEDKPVKIHIEVNPCRPFETTERSLAWLAENGFIVRYQAGPARYIQVVTFKDHQNPHQKEPASKIPAPQASPGPAPDKTGASPVQEPVDNKCGPADSLFSDSGLLNPDSPSPIPVTATPVADACKPEAVVTFAHIQAAYPDFTGRQDWINAEHHCNQRIDRDGLSWPDLLAAAERYRAYCENGGVSGPRFVMTPGNFFSAADRPWLQDWKPPPSKAQAKQDKNVLASQQWLAEQEAKDAAH
jgi:hypothetical protein